MLASASLVALVLAATPPPVTLTLTPPHVGRPSESSASGGATRFVAPWRPQVPGQRSATVSQAPMVQLWAATDAAHPDSSADVWAWQAGDGLHVVVRAFDNTPSQRHTGRAIAEGDSLTLTLSPELEQRGRRAGGAEYRGTADVVATFARTVQGAEGWRQGGPGELDGQAWGAPLHIDRDAASGTVTYDIVVPWTLLRSAPGLHTHIGMGLRIRDFGLYGRLAHTLRWGDDVRDGVRPDTLVPVALEAPPRGTLSVAGGEVRVLDGRAAMPLQIYADAPAAGVEVRCPGGRAKLALGQGLEARTVAVQLSPAAARRGGTCQACVRAPLLPEACTPLWARPLDAPLQAARDVLARWLATSPAPPVASHVVALQALLLEAEADARAEAEAGGSSAHLEAEALAGRIASEGQDIAGWEAAIRRGERPLVQVLRAATDGALVPYRLYLPAVAAAPAAGAAVLPAVSARPMVVFLHGKGTGSRTLFAASAIAPARRGLADAYLMMPWARGNYGYSGIAEQDVGEAREAVAREHAVDVDRVTLAGFSMGGAGAWSLALHDPTPWAAVAVASGASWFTALGQRLGENAEHLPMGLWHGEMDSVVPVTEAYRMVQELRRGGVSFEAHFAPHEGHVLTEDTWTRMATWLVAHRRQHPTAWRYTSDGPMHRGRQGILMHYDAARGLYPWIDVTFAGHTLSIESHNTDGLELDLLHGWDLPEFIDVYWQHEHVYRGRPLQLTLGRGATRP